MEGAPRRLRGRAPGEPGASAWLYVLPAFVVYAAFLLFPLLRSLQFSFYSWDGISSDSTFAGLANYRKVLTDPDLLAAFGHALILMLFFAVLPICIGLALAAVLNRAKVWGLGFFRTVVFLPQVVAMVVIAVSWRRVYAPEGPLNQVLQALGLGSWAKAWLGDYTWALPAVGFVGTWFEIGLVTVLLLAGMGRINKELFEAARLDGAGAFREFRYITLPAVRGEIAVAATLTVIAALKTFDLVYLTTRGGPGNSTSVPSYQVYHLAFEQGLVGVATALAVVLTMVIFVISTIINRIGDRET